MKRKFLILTLFIGAVSHCSRSDYNRLSAIDAWKSNPAVQMKEMGDGKSIELRAYFPFKKGFHFGQGAYMILPQGISDRLAGHRIQIRLQVRRTAQNPSHSFSAGYFVNPRIHSPWVRFEPLSKSDGFAFSYRVPSKKGDHYLALYPDLEGKGRGIVVEKVEVSILSDDKKKTN